MGRHQRPNEQRQGGDGFCNFFVKPRIGAKDRGITYEGRKAKIFEPRMPLAKRDRDFAGEEIGRIVRRSEVDIE
jgi:hypothetical protein